MSRAGTPIAGPVALLEAMARIEPKREFLHGEHDRLTYGEAVERVARLTGLLRRRGLAPGMRVVLATHDDLARRDPVVTGRIVQAEDQALGDA